MTKKTQRRPLSKKLVFSLAGIAALLLYAWLVPWLASEDLLSGDLLRSRQAPNWQHWFGTDATGRDLLVRVAQGLRVSLLVAGACAVISTVLGVLIGAVAAVRGGWVDAVLMRLTDMVNALPQLLVGLVIVAFYPGSLPLIIASIALVHWSPIARIVRSVALSTRELEYVDAARLAGAGPRWIAWHHLIPAVAGQAKVAVILSFPHAIWHESSLSFLGLGLSPDRASLGTLLENARAEILIGCWWMFVFPAGALVVVTLLIMALASALGQGQERASRWRKNNPHPAGTDTPGPTLGGSKPDSAPPALVRVEDLSVVFPQPAGGAAALQNIDFQLHPGQLHVLAGENGAGKSLLSRVVTGVVPAGAQVSGRVQINGQDLSEVLLAPSAPQWKAVRGKVIGVAPQTAATALAPNRRVETQLLDTLAALRPALTKNQAKTEVRQLCARAHFPVQALRAFPHQLSGGMAIRAGLAAALAGNPQCLIADEVTAGLDAQLELEILDLLRELADQGLAVLLITHDLAALQRKPIADWITVLQQGETVESGPAAPTLKHPQSEYLQSLLQALPQNGMQLPQASQLAETEPVSRRGNAADGSPELAVPESTVLESTVLRLDNITAGYGNRVVVKGFNLEVKRGQTVGIFGPSGVGKTTVAKVIAGLLPPWEGSARVLGKTAMLFQSPRRSVSPYLTLYQIMAEPLFIAKMNPEAVRERVEAVVSELGINPSFLKRRSEQVSDGQLQLVALGRALVTDPDLVICDEATAMLDAIHAAKIVGVLRRRSQEQGLAVLVISHDQELLDFWTESTKEMAALASG